MSVLKGLRVIDFGQYIAGPLAAMLLADHGAEVIRVEVPRGPRLNTAGNAMWNRGKRSIVLDLKDAADLGTARALIATADVVIENFRPGVMARLGLDPEQLCRQHSGLIWCALPGFAAEDPRAPVAAWEGLLGAASGNFRLRVQDKQNDAGRGLPIEDDGRPIYSPVPVASIFGACLGALSIAMALIARRRDGRGQTIEVPLHDAMIASIGNPTWDGKPGTPWMRPYECADGRWIDLICYNEGFVRALIEEAGVQHWLDEAFVGDVRRPFRSTPEQATALFGRLERLFRTRTANQWETALSRAGVPVAVCRTTEQFLKLSQATESGAIMALTDPRLGQTRQPGFLVNLEKTPCDAPRPAPLPDQDGEAILAELDSAPARKVPVGPEDTRPPLAGIGAIDFGTVLVGPACGRTLAEFGADVVKIDSPHGAGPDPHVSRGKRSIMLDLKSTAGRDIALRLAEISDVVVQNFRLGVAERLGVGPDDLASVNKALVYMSFNAYGRTGPWASRPGFENQAQAATGMQERFGGAGSPVKEPLTINDYATAFLGAYGVALALLHRGGEGAGAGQHVHTSLIHSACLMQAAMLIEYAGKPQDDPRGQHCLGSGALHRAYLAQDGWLFLGAREDQLPAMDAISGLAGIAACRPERLALFLEERLATGSVAQWTERLVAAGIGAHAVRTVAECMAEPYVRERGLCIEREHPDGGTVLTIGPVPRLSRTPLEPGRVLRPTMDAEEILAGIGLEDRLEALLEARAVEIRRPRSSRGDGASRAKAPGPGVAVPHGAV